MLLIVDDDPAVLEQAKVLDSGRGVFFAANAEQAKSLMGTVGAEFSVVMVDLDLPGQDGFSLIREMHTNFPDLPLIAIIGVCDQHVLESAKLLGAIEALQKPIGHEWKAALDRVRSKAARP